VIFRFYCDESYDGKALNPDYFTISGFFSDQTTWEEIENDWNGINSAYGVEDGFHASELNGRGKKSRYAGWCKCKACDYSSELLESVTRHKERMYAYNCGIRGDAYRAVISDEGRIKMGHPWVVCFHSCIAKVAKDMDRGRFPLEDTFSVVIARENRFDNIAVASFGRMTTNPLFECRHRLMTCTPGLPERIIGLQVADLMAYEYYKRMREDSDEPKRTPLRLIQDNNGYWEGFFAESTFVKLKDKIEAIVCGPDQLIILPNE
jgi:hypothetical protein